MDFLATFFLGCFLFGLVFAIGSVVLGISDLVPHVGDGVHGIGNGPAAPHVGHLGHHGAAGHAASSSQSGGALGNVSPWNLTCIMAFVAWFGGVGYLATAGFGVAAVISILAALAAGFVGWWIVFVFFSRVLYRRHFELDPEDYRLEGTVARVTVPIHEGRTGEIQYIQAGSIRSDGARSASGQSIDRNTEVVVIRYEKGLAIVQPWQEFVESGDGRTN
ncbi:MAG: NfeD family protein [Chloroflexi bacterium]|nr:NfeD family protein [Chloroflexota bacterium]